MLEPSPRPGPGELPVPSTEGRGQRASVAGGDHQPRNGGSPKLMRSDVPSSPVLGPDVPEAAVCQSRAGKGWALH